METAPSSNLSAPVSEQPNLANRCVQQQIIHDTQAPNAGYFEKLPVLVSGKLSHPPDFEHCTITVSKCLHGKQ